MKLLIINNLASGLGDGTIYDYLRLFMQDADEVVMRATNGTTPIEDLLHDATEFDTVVACGGDGTITAVSFALADTGVPILPYPAGTANLLALNLNLPSEPHVLAKLTREGRQLDFDMGELTFNNKTVGFGMIAGAGYDAKIMKSALPNKKIFGPMAYAGAALANAIPQVSHFTLDLDGEIIECDGIGVLVINFSRIQFDIPLTHSNSPRDGAFDVAILKAQNAFELIPTLLAGILDRDGEFPTRSDSFQIYEAKCVKVSADPPVAIQFDGEVADGTTPFTATIRPRTTTFIVPEDSYKQFKQ